MSHELDFTKGKAAIAYKRDNGVPWHGHGGYIENGMTTEEIQKVAGLDFRIEKAPAIYRIPNPNFIEGDAESPEMIERAFENRAVIYRSDTGAALSVMSENSYTPAQPIELLDGLMQLVNGNGFEMDVAGALSGGSVVWGLAKRKDELGELPGGDVVLPYILLLTSYNGKYARTARATSVRVVCQNTVSLSATMDAATTSKQRNSGEFDADKLFAQLGEYDQAFANYVTYAKDMANQRLTSDMMKRFFTKLYMPDAFVQPDAWTKSAIDADRKGVTANAKNKVAKLINLFIDSPGSNLPSADGTLWGAVNAVTYYQDHIANTRENKRWESATIGQGNGLKDAAMSLALDMI